MARCRCCSGYVPQLVCDVSYYDPALMMQDVMTGFLNPSQTDDEGYTIEWDGTLVGNTPKALQAKFECVPSSVWGLHVWRLTLTCPDGSDQVLSWDANPNQLCSSGTGLTGTINLSCAMNASVSVHSS